MKGELSLRVFHKSLNPANSWLDGGTANGPEPVTLVPSLSKDEIRRLMKHAVSGQPAPSGGGLARDSVGRIFRAGRRGSASRGMPKRAAPEVRTRRSERAEGAGSATAARRPVGMPKRERRGRPRVWDAKTRPHRGRRGVPGSRACKEREERSEQAEERVESGEESEQRGTPRMKWKMVDQVHTE